MHVASTNINYHYLGFLPQNRYICTIIQEEMHIKVENIDAFNRYFNQPTYHPLVSVANLADADLSLFEPTDFGMYCVVLMDADFGELMLRGTCMKYHSGMMFTMKPGDVVAMNLNHNVRPRGRMLAFRPELLNGTGLGRDFYMFNFFDYNVAEALSLSDSERLVAINCFNNINSELQAPDDELTSHMLRLGIGQLLTSCRRFYERQFDVQKAQSTGFVQRLDALLDNYLAPESKLPTTLGQPTVSWCAQQFHLTPSYFGDIIHRETGTTAQQYIQQKVLERAKVLMSNKDLSINEIAYALGFEYPNHFTRLFRTKEGITPTLFRKQYI